MATTFITRKTARDALVALFTANGKWQKVFGYIPTEDEIQGQSPLSVILSEGTDQQLQGVNTNECTYYFRCSNWIRASDIVLGGTFDHQDAEDKLDELDREFRQTIRNNITVDGGKAIIKFDGTSNTSSELLYEVVYRVENYRIAVTYPSGG